MGTGVAGALEQCAVKQTGCLQCTKSISKLVQIIININIAEHNVPHCCHTRARSSIICYRTSVP